MVQSARIKLFPGTGVQTRSGRGGGCCSGRMLANWVRRSITSSKEKCSVACAGPLSDVSCAEPELGGEDGALRLSIPAYHALEEETMYTSLTSSE